MPPMGSGTDPAARQSSVSRMADAYARVCSGKIRTTQASQQRSSASRSAGRPHQTKGFHQ